MSDGTLADGLFPSPVPDGPYPTELLALSQQAAGLRYLLSGEEGDEQLLFFGHPDARDVVAAVTAIDIPRRRTPHATDVCFTHARLWWRCPWHAAPDEECLPCDVATEDGWLEWSLSAGDAARPEAFPVVVWS